jgi:large subunit ribosomal protein L22
MDVMAVTKYVRLSASKSHDLARAIQGKPVSEALQITQFSDRKAGLNLNKTLRSAVANAENNNGLSADNLYVKIAAVEKGPALKRWWSRARGGASPVLRPTSHVRIVLTDEKPRRK